MRCNIIVCLLVSCLWMGAVYGENKLSESAPAIIPKSSFTHIPVHSSIDWEQQQIQIEAAGAQKLGPLLAAMKASFLNLMQSFRVDSHTIVGSLMEQDPGLKEELETIFDQALPDSLSPKKVKLIIPLYGETGIAKAIFYKTFEPNDQNKALSPLAQAKALMISEEAYTGLIIDARKAQMAPCLIPQIRGLKSRQIIYSCQTVDFMFAMDYGLGSYAASIGAAKKNPRVGNNPLILKAVSTEGPFRSTVNLSDADIDTLKQANKLGFLEKARVVFVL